MVKGGRYSFFRIAVPFCVVFLLVAFPSGYSNAEEKPAGKAVFVRKPVIAQSPSSVRQLTFFSPIFTQDVIRAGKSGRARFVLGDRTMLALEGEGELAISDYVFDAENQEGDGLITRVIAGSIRVLTGLIGKRKPKAVRLLTSTGTIGIRGTAVQIEVFPDGHHEVTFAFGQGWVETDSGKVEVGEGATANVADAITLPRLFQKPVSAEDPAEIARNLSGLPLAEIGGRIGTLVSEIEDSEQIVLLGMMEQVRGASPERSLEVFQSLLRNNPALSEAFILTETRLHPELAPSILRTSASSGVPVGQAMEDVLRSLDAPTTHQVESILMEAVESGLSRDGAEEVLQQLRDEGVCP